MQAINFLGPNEARRDFENLAAQYKAQTGFSTELLLVPGAGKHGGPYWQCLRWEV
jgi:hypothetical protein